MINTVKYQHSVFVGYKEQNVIEYLEFYKKRLLDLIESVEFTKYKKYNQKKREMVFSEYACIDKKIHALKNLEIDCDLMVGEVDIYNY